MSCLEVKQSFKHANGDAYWLCQALRMALVFALFSAIVPAEFSPQLRSQIWPNLAVESVASHCRVRERRVLCGVCSETDCSR
jgi:hypothetical protein